jgi:hypothetical protein
MSAESTPSHCCRKATAALLPSRLQSRAPRRQLTAIEGELVGSKLSAEQQQQLDASPAQKRRRSRPASRPCPRRPSRSPSARFASRSAIDALEKQAFQLGIELQSQAAQLTAIRKYVDDTRAQRKAARRQPRRREGVP